MQLLLFKSCFNCSCVRYRRKNPMYMSAVDARRGRFRSHYDDLSFYSEIEPLEEYDVDAATGDLLQQQQQSGHIYDDLDDAMSDVTMTTNNEKDVTIRWADETLCRADGDNNKSAREFYESGRKKCRRRSKSPGMRPPRELADHFKYVDPHDEGMTDDQLKDIPYTRVELVEVVLTDTDGARVRYSPRTKNRIRLSRRAASSCRERNENLPPNRSIVCNDGSQSNFLPDGEAPPPYLAHQIPYKTRRSISSQALDNRLVASGDTNNNNSVLQQRQQYNHQQHQQSVRRQNSDSGRPRYKNDGGDDDANNINNNVDYVIVRRTPSNVSMGFEV
ncbi:hypothetical protein HELRODRAFT_180150 [Helobdella robusta]|uniref:Uncharacterized protein n=1 Tax=Helobdella robusta TaxID=6412 RepID=T1FFI9_HELRO|nr:hypothetical protein HELRODRAFT_180150 [Helobdella robusta]ESN94804.1 hypothetical protein HELRODRAFT_180150 [Helobdella robusta]